jgi:molecular chaperone GrpE
MNNPHNAPTAETEMPQPVEAEASEIQAEVGQVAAAVEEEREQQLKQLQAQLATYEQQQREQQLRLLAEKQNLQRRFEQDLEKAHQFSLEKFVKALLPVLDSFEQAVALADRDNLSALPMIEGIELTFKSLQDTLHKFKVEAVGECGTPFDPQWHQAMMLVDSVEYLPNHIVTVMQRGYRLQGRLLRPAMVSVVRSQ